MIFEKTEHSRRARENDESSLSFSLSLSLSLFIYTNMRNIHFRKHTMHLSQKYYLEEKWAFISF